MPARYTLQKERSSSTNNGAEGEGGHVRPFSVRDLRTALGPTPIVIKPSRDVSEGFGERARTAYSSAEDMEEVSVGSRTIRSTARSESSVRSSLTSIARRSDWESRSSRFCGTPII